VVELHKISVGPNSGRGQTSPPPFLLPLLFTLSLSFPFSFPLLSPLLPLDVGPVIAAVGSAGAL